MLDKTRELASTLAAIWRAFEAATFTQDGLHIRPTADDRLEGIQAFREAARSLCVPGPLDGLAIDLGLPEKSAEVLALDNALKDARERHHMAQAHEQELRDEHFRAEDGPSIAYRQAFEDAKVTWEDFKKLRAGYDFEPAVQQFRAATGLALMAAFAALTPQFGAAKAELRKMLADPDLAADAELATLEAYKHLARMTSR